MILALDTYYYENKAKTVGLEFANWTDATETRIIDEILENIAEYESGAFYKRELPCTVSLLQNNKPNNYEAIVVDGYVYLDDNGKYGLGGYLYEKLDRRIPIIGVAKTDFVSLHKNKFLLYRGESKNPLFITAIGIDLEEAAQKIKTMSGEYRMPALLKKLDTLTKEK